MMNVTYLVGLKILMKESSLISSSGFFDFPFLSLEFSAVVVFSAVMFRRNSEETEALSSSSMCMFSATMSSHEGRLKILGGVVKVVFLEIMSVSGGGCWRNSFSIEATVKFVIELLLGLLLFF